MGIPKGYPDYVLHKMVTVMRNGEEVKISKRAGSYVTVRDPDRVEQWRRRNHPRPRWTPACGLDGTIRRAAATPCVSS